MSNSAAIPARPGVDDEVHYRHMLHALQLADKCAPTMTAFCVGCTIYHYDTEASGATEPVGRLMSDGYSRELPGNTHAEQCALDKIVSRCDGAETNATGEASTQGPTANTPVLELDLYTTMEPCSKRASSPLGCAQRIIAFNNAHHRLSTEQGKVTLRVSRVFQGVREPADFQLCEGQRLLREAGVEVHTVVPPSGVAEGSTDWLEKECLRIAKRSHADEPPAPSEDIVRRWKEHRAA